ncbi:MAG TPA: hypothetical protein VFK05_00150 [Polyangiaceae bacterium]|nr:hypothetical protein [Polyangiaceae bacterium]
MNLRVALLLLGGWFSIACQIALGDFTIDTTRLAVSCESGSTRCAERQLQSCMGGNEWRVLATCDSADLCNLRSLGCAPCEPGSYQCSDSQPQLCDPDSHWVAATPVPCASASLCDVPEDGSAAKCLPPGCPAAGQMQCLDGHLQRCPLSQKAWQDVEICASPALCDLDLANQQVAAGKPATCVLPTCAPGQFNCETGSPQPCKADRTGWDTATSSCVGSTCNPQTGDCSECVPFSYACSGRNLQRCTEQKIWESTACSSALSCNTGAVQGCDPPLCTPGEFRCNTTSALERCRSDGTKWEPIEQCINRVLCNPKETRCEVPRCPIAGATRCQGNTQQACRADLTGWAEVNACSASGSCDPELGCLEAGCESGSYRCNDISLETCSNGKWTRLASCQTTALCDAAHHECVAATCAPGERKCQGNVLLRCNAALDGWDELETCGGDTTCSPDTARCEKR